MRRLLLALTVLTAGLMGAAQADVNDTRNLFTGDKLWEICTASAPDPEIAVCLGYVVGIADAIFALRGNGQDFIGLRACMPDHITAGQVTNVVTKFLGEHSELRHYIAASLIAHALADAFPCPR